MSKMYFAIIEAVPKGGSDDAREYGGAQVACWINSVDFLIARERARGMVEGSDWTVQSIDEEKIISEEDYESGDEGFEYFEQALIDGEVCVFYTYPPE